MQFDVTKYLKRAGLEEKIRDRLEAQKRHQRNCYLKRREWQLQQFHIGYEADWSQDEIIFHLRQLRKSLRKAKLRNPYSRGLIILPMVEIAYECEVELAAQEAA